MTFALIFIVSIIVFYYTYFNILFPIFVYISPLLILLYLTTKMRKALVSMSKRGNEICPRSNTQNVKREKRITLSLIKVLFVFLFCQTTSAIPYVLHLLYVRRGLVRVEIVYVAFLLRHIFLVINSSVNMPIYVCFSEHYRQLVR